MTVKGAGRLAAGAVTVVMLAGCAAVPPPVNRAGEAPATPQAAATPVPPPPPVAIRAPIVPADREFHYDGKFIQGGMVRGKIPSGTRSLTFDGKTIPVADDGRFLIAFDRDHGEQALLVATLSDGSKVSKTLPVAKRAWRIQRLNHLPKVSQPSAEFQRRRPKELDQIHAARAIDTGSQGWRQDFMWPATGRISGVFGSQRFYQGEPGAYHSGVDIAVPTGTPVLAPADGVVTLAQSDPFTLEGKLVFLDHGMGLNSVFIHLSKIDVHEGDHVKRGQKIAESGSTGRATGPHLHWGLKWRDARIDPMLIAGPMPKR
ncbi:M23 family metallopeptidase [Stakelama sp. CBK3Z-3]|uniref:M23 family metallopeptidase n=1 Tax=Stakelama flava TaxID=2860338 RepID=A0ABS6XNI4_9SPHN|nr:M23 family metallopeptidase [Stakelama flava]MBW4330961.1 M23 family metallopeptidase [Stakelama flava]